MTKESPTETHKEALLELLGICQNSFSSCFSINDDRSAIVVSSTGRAFAKHAALSLLVKADKVEGMNYTPFEEELNGMSVRTGERGETVVTVPLDDERLPSVITSALCKRINIYLGGSERDLLSQSTVDAENYIDRWVDRLETLKASGLLDEVEVKNALGDIPHLADRFDVPGVARLAEFVDSVAPARDRISEGAAAEPTDQVSCTDASLAGVSASKGQSTGI